jgi:hypothetical protein
LFFGKGSEVTGTPLLLASIVALLYIIVAKEIVIQIPMFVRAPVQLCLSLVAYPHRCELSVPVSRASQRCPDPRLALSVTLAAHMPSDDSE